MARVMVRQEMIESGELALVPEAQLKEALRRIRDDPNAGKPLRRALAGCRSIRVGGSENRLVYRYHPADDWVECLALERRRSGEAYSTAQGRL